MTIFRVSYRHELVLRHVDSLELAQLFIFLGAASSFISLPFLFSGSLSLSLLRALLARVHISVENEESAEKGMNFTRGLVWMLKEWEESSKIRIFALARLYFGTDSWISRNQWAYLRAKEYCSSGKRGKKKKRLFLVDFSLIDVFVARYLSVLKLSDFFLFVSSFFPISFLEMIFYQSIYVKFNYSRSYVNLLYF